MAMNMDNSNPTSVVGEPPAITAPVRLKGESNSEVLFNWLTVKCFLWMLRPPYDGELERMVGSFVRIRLGFKLIKWLKKPNHSDSHEALLAPSDEESRRAAFARLERLLKVHFFITGGSENG